MPLKTKQMQVAMCDNCGKQVVGEVGDSLPGYYLTVVHVPEDDLDGQPASIQADVFACGGFCLSGAIHNTLERCQLSEGDQQEALHMLEMRGKGVDTSPALAIYNELTGDRIGTALPVEPSGSSVRSVPDLEPPDPGNGGYTS